MWVSCRVVALLLVGGVLASGPLWGGADPNTYTTATGYSGSGKHAKSGIAGLIIAADEAGLKFVCFSYFVLTEARIRGKVSGTVERLSSNGAETLAVFRKNKIQELELDDLGVPDDPCLPELPGAAFSFRIGLVSECAEVFVPLREGDVLRWSLRFQRAPKLKGLIASYNISGSVLPLTPFSPVATHLQQASEWSARSALYPLLEQWAILPWDR